MWFNMDFLVFEVIKILYIENEKEKRPRDMSMQMKKNRSVVIYKECDDKKIHKHTYVTLALSSRIFFNKRKI